MQEDLIDVEMPDGVIVSGVPSNITQQELKARYYKYANTDILQQQRQSFPTSAEQGGPTGQAIQSSFNPLEIAKGLGQSIANTGLAGLQWGQNIVGARVMPTPPSFTPKNEGQRVGNTAGYIGLSSIPAIASAGTSLPTQIAAGGLGMGLAAAGAGEDPQTMSALGMGLPVAGRLLGTVAKAIPRKMSQAANEWMGVHSKWVEHGANPGARLANEGILTGTRQEVKEQVEDRLADAGRQLQVKLTQRRFLNNLDTEPLVMTALNNATKRIGIGSDPAFQARLMNTLDDIVTSAPNLGHMNPSEVNALKSKIGDSIKWSGAPYEGEINQVLLEIYGGLNDMVKSNVPGVERVLSRYADLRVAANALKESIAKETVSTGMQRGLGTAAATAVGKPAAKVATGAGILGGAAYGVKRLLGY